MSLAVGEFTAFWVSTESLSEAFWVASRASEAVCLTASPVIFASWASFWESDWLQLARVRARLAKKVATERDFMEIRRSYRACAERIGAGGGSEHKGKCLGWRMFSRKKEERKVETLALQLIQRGAVGLLQRVHNLVTRHSPRMCLVLPQSSLPMHPEVPNSNHAYRKEVPYGRLLPMRSRARELKMKRILIIEDDRDIVELVRYNLANEGFQVNAALDGTAGLTSLKKTPPDLLLLDLMLPKISGLEICREVRKDESLNRLPILMLTARGDEADRVVGLEMGADDYVTKPFSPRELIARVKALLRRAEPPAESPRIIEVGKLAIDPASYRVSQSGKPVPLSTLEFRLLYYLASRPNRVFTRDQLLDAVWGTDRFVTPRSVDVYVRRLREKIESDPENPLHLKTVRGAGYLFETRAA